MVKAYFDNHTCLQTRKVRHCTATFLSQEVAQTIVPNPQIPLKDLAEGLQRKFSVGVSNMKAYRAKVIAQNMVKGDYTEQYKGLRDYILKLQRANPGTTMKLDLEVELGQESQRRKFKRVYICLGALKQGFIACKKELLGLDGAFMKGPYLGQILIAVGVDPSQGIYPVAYAIVEAETMDSWSWFLECLGDDLDLGRNSNFTFITDRQKGVVPALSRVFPSAEHRCCLRHIHKNMKKQWKGKLYKDLLWKCATATTVPKFDKCMEDLKAVNTEAYKYLKDIPPNHWARAYFTGRAHCDVLINNMCEVFNKQLVEGRDKPIIKALEYINEYLMKRIVIVQKLISKSGGHLTPAATKIFDKIKKDAAQYVVKWNEGDKYQVNGPWQDQCVVDSSKQVCSCRNWELSGIPCRHAVATIWYMAMNGEQVGVPENWVHESYTMGCWKAVYEYKVCPLNGRDEWPKSECPLILTPPVHHTQPGRPKKKRKRTDEELSQPIVRGCKLSRAGKTVTCAKCKKRGHNSRSCKGQEEKAT